MFESFRVTISPYSTSSHCLGTLHTIFESHAHLIRTLTIRNTISPDCRVETRRFSRDVQDIIGRGFLLCTQIQSLVCSESHGMFSKQSWLSLWVPANLTSLTFMPNKGSTDLSYCLLVMKDSLQSLKIINWHSQHDNPSPFHLPSSLLHLTHLALIGCHPPPPHIKKLFAHIITPSSPQNLTPTVPLRSLTVRSISCTELAGIISILAMRQFGTHLRTLYITSSRAGDMDNVVDRTIPITLLCLCPNLVEFAYDGHMDERVLSSLPFILTVLELSPRNYCTSSKVKNLSPEFLALWLRDGLHRKRARQGCAMSSYMFSTWMRLT